LSYTSQEKGPNLGVIFFTDGMAFFSFFKVATHVITFNETSEEFNIGINLSTFSLVGAIGVPAYDSF